MLHYEFAEICWNIFAGYSRILSSIPEGQITPNYRKNLQNYRKITQTKFVVRHCLSEGSLVHRALPCTRKSLHRRVHQGSTLTSDCRTYPVKIGCGPVKQQTYKSMGASSFFHPKIESENIPNLSVRSVFTAHIIIGSFDVCWSEMKHSDWFKYFLLHVSTPVYRMLQNHKQKAHGVFRATWHIRCTVKMIQSVLIGWQRLIMNRIHQKFKMKMAATMSSQRKRKRSEKQDNTCRHQLYDWTKRTRKFSLKWKDDFPRDSLEENNRICRRSWQWQHVIWDASKTLFPEFAAVCDMYTKFSTLYALEILNVIIIK